MRQNQELGEIFRSLQSSSKLVEDDPAGFHLWQTPGGSYWVPSGSDSAGAPGRMPFYSMAEQQSGEYRDSAVRIHPGDIVLDCGANVGVFTREAIAAGASLVVAVEPAPENLVCLRRNLEPEITHGKVIVCAKGVWDKDDWLFLSVDPSFSEVDSFVMTPRPNTRRSNVKVALTTIDKLAAELRLPRVDFIKMDIEGSEARALRGAANVLRKYHPRMAIAGEHYSSDSVVLPSIVQRITPYQVTFGACSVRPDAYIAPEVLFFR